MSRKEIDSPRADVDKTSHRVGEPVPLPPGLGLQKQRSEPEGPRSLAFRQRSVVAGIPPGGRGEDAASYPAKEQRAPLPLTGALLLHSPT